jgi:EmrB/QacA subfamily drug resistance transporter
VSVDDLPVTATVGVQEAPARPATGAPPAPEREPQRAPAPQAPPAPATPSGGWGLPLVVLIVGMFMSILDTSIVNVAIPTIQNAFGTTTDEIQWIATSYTLALGVVVPVSAWLSDRFGMKRTYNVSLLAFAAGSALCGLAWNLESMVVFRIIQAMPGGILPVVTLSMVYRIVPREKIGAAMGLYGLGIIVAPAIGPTLGGYLVEYVDWRLIFFINVPVGILGAIAAVIVLPTFPAVKSQRFDVLGFVAIAGGLFALLLALSEGQSWGWTSYRIIILLSAGVLLLALFVVIELEVDHPLLDVRVFRYWPYTNSLLLISVLMVGLFATLFYIPLFLQQAQGLGAFDAGLLLLPQALVMAVLMPIAGRLYDKIGPRWPAVIGLTIVAIGTYSLHNMSLDISRGEIAGLLALRAGGMGMAMMPVMTGGVAAVPMRFVGTASAFNNVVQRSAAALGLAVLTALMTTQRAQMLGDRTALVGSDTPMPALLPGPSGQVAGMYAVYQQTQTQVFVAALDQLMVITAAMTLVGVALAFMLRSGPAKTAGGPGEAASAAH